MNAYIMKHVPAHLQLLLVQHDTHSSFSLLTCCYHLYGCVLCQHLVTLGGVWSITTWYIPVYTTTYNWKQ